ncbi:hypothetical protein CGGC5_v007118 [Colletotrichum fructicola Nara gc5]|uniref:Uncharacterized protein n=1 Tax=Colletotrichum fructicola (strain Nara gc5) TaxID=1213859 RepID=A0A7J6J4T7_COLFN|nr:hypothetical protein CGGC5_v007118 [Colletotrichum fructicola Nara gc5]
MRPPSAGRKSPLSVTSKVGQHSPAGYITPFRSSLFSQQSAISPFTSATPNSTFAVSCAAETVFEEYHWPLVTSCSVKFLRFQIVRPVTGRQQQASKNHDTSTKWHSLLGSHPAQMSHESRAILNRLSI